MKAPQFFLFYFFWFFFLTNILTDIVSPLNYLLIWQVSVVVLLMILLQYMLTCNVA